MRLVLGGLSAVLLAASASCTGSSSDDSADDSADRQQTSPGATIQARPIPLSIRIDTVSGRLARPRREAVVRGVGRTVSDYLDAGFLGKYPRTGFDGAFRSLTSGLGREARRDRALLTNAELGRQVRSVTATTKKARLSVLAPKGSPAGVTARVRLVYLVDRGPGDSTRVTTSGRLLLTRRESGWRIFGYDLARSAVAVARANAQ